MDRNKIFKNAKILIKIINFPMIWVGFANGSGSMTSKVLLIRIRQNDTDPDPKP